MCDVFWRRFLSHLSGEEVDSLATHRQRIFLSHLSGEEVSTKSLNEDALFLSHLSGEEVCFLLMRQEL